MKIILDTNRLSIDKVGTTFQYNDRFYRAIKQEAIKDVKDLLDCGLIEELSNRKLFPRTWIANLEVHGFDLILEHQKINHVTYPYEWSFSMLKDASLCILRVAEICAKYGYGLHDMHNYNIIFEGCFPMFVDLGSIQKGITLVSRIDSFIDYNFLPIKLISIGEMTFAKRILSDEYLVRYLPNQNYYSSRLTKDFIYELYSGNPKNVIKKFLNSFGGNYKLKFDHQTIEKLRSRILKIQKGSIATVWGTYQQTYQESGETEIQSRFSRIIKIINDLEVTEVLDIGGNQGYLTRLIKKNCLKVNEAICLDYDENGVDSFYLRSKGLDSARQLYPVHSNILYPISVNYFPPFEERLRSELVLALAITHHLILSQHFPLDFIFKKLKELSKKYVFVEFMPLGLWGGNELPEIPEWYSVEWFQFHFQRYFSIYLIEKIEINRILFVGFLQ